MWYVYVLDTMSLESGMVAACYKSGFTRDHLICTFYKKQVP